MAQQLKTAELRGVLDEITPVLDEVLDHRHGKTVFQLWRGLRQLGVGIFAKQVLIELQPKIGQRVGRIVVIGDDLGTADALIGVIEFDINRVIGFLLPVAVSRRARSGALFVGRGQDFF